jgi:DNA-directed RNA polymerase specialized sigma24 family protein
VTRKEFEEWRRGDERAAARLFDLHQSWLHALVERELGAKLRTKVETHDVVQDVGVRLLQYEPKAEDGALDRLQRLLRAMVQHALADLHRRFFESERRGRGEERPIASDSRALDQLPCDPITSPSRAFVRREETTLTRLCVHFVKPDARDLLARRWWLDQPFAEIAARLDEREATLRMRVLRAVQALGAVMAKLKPEFDRLDAEDRELVRQRIELDVSFAEIARQRRWTRVQACDRFQQAMRTLGGRVGLRFWPIGDDWPWCLRDDAKS